MNRINKAIQDLMKKSLAFRITTYIFRGLLSIFVVVMLLRSCFYDKKEFVPFSAKVESYNTDWYKQGGVYCQNIELDNGECLLANGFTAIVEGKKTRLIDYIAEGDSVICECIDVTYVIRDDTVSYKFTYSSKDFK